jgi:outer membrane protein assembly factor BamB
MFTRAISSLAVAALLCCSSAGADPAAERAAEILQVTGATGGLIVHLGCGDGRLTAALSAGDSFVVQGLDADARSVDTARQHIRSLGLYGKVSAEQLSGKRLPYVDNLVNLVVAEELGGVPMDEVMRVLSPLGVAYVKQGGQWTKTVKPWPKEIDQWTHYLHDPSNNAVAHDAEVGPPKGLRWFAGPLYCRSHETDSSISAMVSANGRLFYILDQGPTGVADQRLPQKWALVARDAFSGVHLWEVPLPEWGWPEWKKAELAGVDWTTISGHRLRSPVALPRRLVSDGDRVYVTLGYNAPVTVLDAATGKTIRTCAGTEDTDEILCCDGTLVLCIRVSHMESGGPRQAAGDGKRRGKKKAAAATVTEAVSGPAADRIMALDAGTGRPLWQVSDVSVVRLSPAIDGGRVFFHDGEHVVCLDLAGGAVQWRSPSQAGDGQLFNSPATLIVCQGVVLVNGQNLEAMAADTGKLLWSSKSSEGPGISNPPDLFLTGGLVWAGGDTQGRDPQTGDVMKTVELQKLINPWHHYRCYRSKATDRYLIWPKQGAEFIDLQGNDNMRHDWFRGPCKYGVLPCNGLVYAGPHQCSCFAGVKLNGFNALSAQSSALASGATAESRLEKGPAYGEKLAISEPSASAGDWPSFRGDSKRSGWSRSAVSADVAPVWEASLAGKLSQPVVADGRLFVAAIDADQVCCLDANDGHSLWSFTPGGRVDSPPTIYGGLALFGSADGWVYCLRASDGVLAWRFSAAPAQRRLVAMGQIESVWPVHGSVLVQNGIAYVAAGRSSFLDGGIFLSALDPASGRLLDEARLEGPYPDVANDDGGSRDMPGARSDVLVGDGEAVYLRQVKFDAALKQQGSWGTENLGNDSTGMRLMSTSDLLDDADFNRTCWRYAPQWSSGQGGGTSGQILVFDGTTTYAAQVYSKHVAQSEVYFPGEDYVKLFAVGNAGLKQEAAAGKGSKSASGTAWTVTVPVYVRAMALADKTLFLAGLPDTIDPKDPLAALEGRMGGILWAASAASGEKLAEYKLDAAPVWDGLAVANGRLYLSLRDGRVLCIRGR